VKAAAQIVCKSFLVNSTRVIKGNMDTRFSGISPPPDLALLPDQIDMWFLFTDQVATASELTLRYRDILDEKERQQEQRFHFARDRHRYLLTRALVRTVLSRYIPISVTDWRFEPSAYGQPTVANDHELARKLSFNISHTEGLIVLAVTCGGAVGVDLECRRRDVDLEVADRYFSPMEVRALRSLPLEAQRHRFLDLWTLKESYIKARGMGLSIPLDKFSIDLDGGTNGAIIFDSDFDDSPDRWRFYQFYPSEEHLGALCVQRYAAMPARLVARNVVPLISETIFECPIVALGKVQSGKR
jgi:4'-phosphopantetheinyl transferase